MNDEIDSPKIQADNKSIAIGEINISGTVTGNITIGHTIVHRPACGCASDMLNGIVATWLRQKSAGKVRSGCQEDCGEGERRNKINDISIEG